LRVRRCAATAALALRGGDAATSLAYGTPPLSVGGGRRDFVRCFGAAVEEVVPPPLKKNFGTLSKFPPARFSNGGEFPPADPFTRRAEKPPAQLVSGTAPPPKFPPTHPVSTTFTISTTCSNIN